MTLAVTADAAATATFSWTAVAIGVLLLVGNGLFVAIEIALLAARRTRVEEAADGGDLRGRRAMKALTELSVTFSAAQLGITMCSLGLGAVAEPALVALFAELFEGTALPPGTGPVLAVVVALSIVVFLHMVVGEMAPKNLALARAERIALVLARPFGWFVTLLRPLILVLNAAANLLVRLVRVDPVDEHKLVHTPDELALALAESRDLGTIAAQDARVMGAALRLATIEAEDAMTPRVDLHAVPDTASLDAVLELARGTGHTRIPVYHQDIDHIVGLVHVKDVLVRSDEELARSTVADLQRPVPAVPESRDLEQLLRDMLDDRSHALVVVDEFGGTAGLLTLEDVLEELVGEIVDEFDDEEHELEPAERVWVLPGTARRDEAERQTELVLTGGEAETISGWIVEQLGRLPERGDRVVTREGWELTVLDLEGRRAGEVEVRAPQDGAGHGEGPDGH